MDQIILYTDEVHLNIMTVSKWPSRRRTESL